MPPFDQGMEGEDEDHIIINVLVVGGPIDLYSAGRLSTNIIMKHETYDLLLCGGPFVSVLQDVVCPPSSSVAVPIPSYVAPPDLNTIEGQLAAGMHVCYRNHHTSNDHLCMMMFCTDTHRG